MSKNSEIEYNNWLANEQLEPTDERHEAFEAGWECAWEVAEEKIKRALW
jgi:hypothetical protein